MALPCLEHFRKQRVEVYEKKEGKKASWLRAHCSLGKGEVGFGSEVGENSDQRSELS